jgi:uncharacterized protein (DUF1697 family)
MITYFAFLRGVNLGKRTVKSPELKAAFESLGFTNVRTYIASGNVIFDAKEKDGAKLEKKIEKGLKDAFGYEVPAVVRSRAEMETILQDNPFAKAPESTKTYISFLSAAPDKAVAKKFEKDRANENERFKFIGRELYMNFSCGFSDSQFFKKPNYEKELGVTATNRNLNTPVKMMALADK